MTPSNRHPVTVARGLRRAFLLQAASGLLAALPRRPAPALAQDVIQFLVGQGTYNQYTVPDAGGQYTQLTSFPQLQQACYATAQSYDWNGTGPGPPVPLRRQWEPDGLARRNWARARPLPTSRAGVP